MPIQQAAILRYRQFRDFRIDLRDPATGKPLEKICFIGPNGTGKSTLLRILANLSTPYCQAALGFGSGPSNHDARDHDWANGHPWAYGELLENDGLVRMQGERIDQRFCWKNLPASDPAFRYLDPVTHPMAPHEREYVSIWDAIREGTTRSSHLPKMQFLLHAAKRDAVSPPSSLTIYCPPESEHTPDQTFINQATLSDALDLPANPSAFEFVHQGELTNWWKRLIWIVKDRERAFLDFLKELEHSGSSLTVSAARVKFEKDRPEILTTLAKLWDRILEPMGLEFDVERASIPTQLKDTFSAYVRLKSSREPLPWADLSTGIRHFLFRLGHIQSLLFQRPAEQPIYLFVDEPEASLHPSFLYDLVSVYRDVAPTSQIFMATHSEIIAAQFRPEERFRLSMREDGSVAVHPGVSPEGDDPNDVLKNDFGVRSLNGTKGEEMWDRFRKLRRLLKKEHDPEKKNALAEEYLKIGQAYNFSPAEIEP